MLLDTVDVNGKLTITVINEEGDEVCTREVRNLVVSAGKGYIASRMVSNTDLVMSHMAVGTSNTAPSVGETGLVTEVGRVVLDTTLLSNTTVTYVATFPPGTGTGALTEAAILNAGSGGTMLCRTNFNEVNKGAADTIVITWNVTIS